MSRKVCKGKHGKNKWKELENKHVKKIQETERNETRSKATQCRATRINEKQDAKWKHEWTTKEIHEIAETYNIANKRNIITEHTNNKTQKIPDTTLNAKTRKHEGHAEKIKLKGLNRKREEQEHECT